MLNHSVVKETTFHSVIGSQSYVVPTDEKHKRNITADLLLTALIDAFSILVIFLLMNFSSNGDLLLLNKNTELPKARGEVLERNPVIKIEDQKIYLENKEVAAEQLVPALLELRKTFQEQHSGEEFPAVLTIQADRHMKYELLNNVVLASSHAGFSDLKFAVIMK